MSACQVSVLLKNWRSFLLTTFVHSGVAHYFRHAKLCRSFCGGPFCGGLFGRTWWTCLNPPLNRIQPNPGNPVPTTGYPVPKPGNKSTHYSSETEHRTVPYKYRKLNPNAIEPGSLHLHFAKKAFSRETRKHKENKNKYTASEINTVVTLRIHMAIGMIQTNTELFQ